MATIVDTDFQGTYPPSGFSESGTVAAIGTSGVQANMSPLSMRVNTTAQTAWINNASQTTQIRTFRCYLYIVTNPSSTCSWVQFTTTTGNIYFRLVVTTRVLRVTHNTTSFDGPALALNRWYLIDALVKSNANPNTTDLRVDAASSATISGTLAVAAANMTADNIGIITTSTSDIYIAHLKITDQAADFPLGPVIPKRVNVMPPLLAQ